MESKRVFFVAHVSVVVDWRIVWSSIGGETNNFQWSLEYIFFGTWCFFGGHVLLDLSKSQIHSRKLFDCVFCLPSLSHAQALKFLGNVKEKNSGVRTKQKSMFEFCFWDPFLWDFFL